MKPPSAASAHAFALAHEHGLRRELGAASSATSASGQQMTHGQRCGVGHARRLCGARAAPGHCAAQAGRRRASSDEPTADGAGDGTAGSSEVDTALAATLGEDQHLSQLPAATAYRVVTRLCVPAHGTCDGCAILSVLQAGQTIQVDAVRKGWVRTSAAWAPIMGGGPKQRGWALVDGASVGLGKLLARA